MPKSSGSGRAAAVDMPGARQRRRGGRLSHRGAKIVHGDDGVVREQRRQLVQADQDYEGHRMLARRSRHQRRACRRDDAAVGQQRVRAHDDLVHARHHGEHGGVGDEGGGRAPRRHLHRQGMPQERRRPLCHHQLRRPPKVWVAAAPSFRSQAAQNHAAAAWHRWRGHWVTSRGSRRGGAAQRIWQLPPLTGVSYTTPYPLEPLPSPGQGVSIDTRRRRAGL